MTGTHKQTATIWICSEFKWIFISLTDSNWIYNNGLTYYTDWWNGLHNYMIKNGRRVGTIFFPFFCCCSVSHWQRLPFTSPQPPREYSYRATWTRPRRCSAMANQRFFVPPPPIYGMCVYVYTDERWTGVTDVNRGRNLFPSRLRRMQWRHVCFRPCPASK